VANRFTYGAAFSPLACCGCRTGLEAEAVITCFQDMAAMGQTIEQCRRHLGVPGDGFENRIAMATVERPLPIEACVIERQERGWFTPPYRLLSRVVAHH
jgi:hypothetical protein